MRLTALAVTQLRKSRQGADEINKAEIAIKQLEPSMTMPEEKGVVLLLSAHVAGAKRDRSKAEQCINDARKIIAAADLARKRLERELIRRFQLFETSPSPLLKNEQESLDDAVFDAEFQLLAA